MLFSLDSGLPVLPADEWDAETDTTVCFTGHRENSVIPYKGNPIYRNITLRTVQLMLCRYIDMAVESGYRRFISGLAAGTDLWAAKYVLSKKHSNKSIELICVIPSGSASAAESCLQMWNAVRTSCSPPVSILLSSTARAAAQITAPPTYTGQGTITWWTRPQLSYRISTKARSNPAPSRL